MTDALSPARPFEKQLEKMLAIALQRAVEPIVKRAVEDAEHEIRRVLAETVVALISSDYEASKMGTILTIRVNLGRPTP